MAYPTGGIKTGPRIFILTAPFRTPVLKSVPSPIPVAGIHATLMSVFLYLLMHDV